MREAILANKKLVIEIAITTLVVLAGFAAYLWYMPESPTVLPTATLTIGTNTIEAELATTADEQNQGLSGRTSLSEGKGMFFVFDAPGNWGIWMKDMQFPLDILWADQNGQIVTIYQNVEPDTYPKSFYPASPASYVLELPAGYVEKHGIATGQQIVVK